MQLVHFKENANPAKYNLGLETQGRSKLPGCVDIIQPAIGPDNRWITGMDEKAYSILSIRDSETREAKIQETKKIREELEELTGLELHALSKYWENFFVEINTQQPLDLALPMDKIKYHIILANKAAAPNLKATAEADYFHVKYYVSREFEDVSDRVEKRKRKSEATTLLDKFIKTPDKLIQLGRYLDLNVSSTTPQENLYDIFYDKIEGDESTDFVRKFLAATKKTPEEVGIKLVFADAIKFNVIRQRDGYFQRGNITYGRRPEEVIEFLSDIKNSGELLSLQEETDQKRKYGQ
jgi:hypothetical protein